MPSHNLEELLKIYNTNNFYVETGSFHGQSIRCAIKTEMFKEIHSIEIDEGLYLNCKDQFKNNNNVKLHLGDSGIVLEDVIRSIDEGITFWLDGHYSGKGSSGSHKYLSPIQEELRIIGNSPFKDQHIIIIDDMACFTEKAISHNRNMHSRPPGYIPKEELYNRLRDINENIKIYIDTDRLGDICVATPHEMLRDDGKHYWRVPSR